MDRYRFPKHSAVIETHEERASLICLRRQAKKVISEAFEAALSMFWLELAHIFGGLSGKSRTDNYLRVILEFGDVIHAAETGIRIAENAYGERVDFVHLVSAKNRLRGYYGEDDVC